MPEKWGIMEKNSGSEHTEMNWERLAEQLESKLGASVELRVEPLGENEEREGRSHLRTYLLEEQAEERLMLAVALDGITDREDALIELAIEAYRSVDSSAFEQEGEARDEEEQSIGFLRDWIVQHLENGQLSAELPEPFASRVGKLKTCIPLVITGEFSAVRKQLPNRELKRLLESFFDTEVQLIPLSDKEWLLLAPGALLSDMSGEEGTEERIEDGLGDFADGLYDMLSSEWLGECHVSIDYPLTSAKALLPAVLHLKEAIQLGKAFHPGSNIHFPWKLQLEKLLTGVPEEERLHFVSRVLKSRDALEGELLTTLESFFALECNVSETAKKLYIHRNTLLYRLDKFKQETGLDVRSFNDAVLVRTAVLLDKVTKRQ
ncbi:helix-turn-helix domain-containing protein [Gorillibacterium sp. CAU 1737]|uniref:PucR family transcriptional regulator n=1 Tax=Gorillibacterium sp. CAU 1737 TaxID=3140362 RepID=UPI00326110FB